MYLFPYKNEWPSDYRAEASLIESRYYGAIKLHHMGSTAVEGMYAKNCIDILGVVSNLQDVQVSVHRLEGVGYVYKGAYGIDGREYFSKSKRKVHLHIFEEGHADIKKHLGFVKVMQSNASLVSELNDLKQRLHAKYPLDKSSYQREKVEFYDKIHKLLT